MSSYYGQTYFGGGFTQPTAGAPHSQTLVVNIDATTAATGSATIPTAAALASITTSATMTSRNTDATNLRWLVYP